MLAFLNKSKVIGLGLAAISFALMLASPNLSLAQEPYPAVARISFVSGAVNYSRGDDPDEWDDAIQNVPLTIGDRIYSSADGRVELELSSGNFVRLAPQSYFSNLNLSDDIKQFYLGEGIASFNIRRLPSGEVIEIDTPNISVTLDEPGNYRIAVDDNGDSRVTVRRGRVTVAANGRQIAVENSEMRIYGIDSPRYEIVGLPAGDAFDRWASERDTRFDRSYSDAYRYASDEIIGVEDLSDYGRWEQIPDYGYAWTPASVAAGWLPFSDGRWFWQDPWGWTWISNEQWGWATSHYGSWTQYRSRWYWVPARPRTRVVYAPACVEFVRVHDDIGWFPLHPRDRYVPWWDRRERERFDGNIMYVNRNYVTIVNQSTFISARPINKYIVRDSVIVRDARSARLTTVDLPVPNRSSIRIFSETGGHRGYKPPPNVLNRVAVVRTAPPLPPPTFQEKLPAIQKAQGKPIEPSQASTLISAADKARTERVPIRPAAEEVRGKEFSARNPSASSGPAPQPITAARGKKLATREALAVQPTPAGQNAGIAGKPAQDRERERQAQQQELDRRKQEQQKEQEQKAQLQERQQQQRLQEPEQGQRELERRQAQQTEEERQAQRQKQPQVQERREDQQPRPSREQQRLEELQRRQAQQEEVRKAQALQQEQEHGKQLKQQQQLQERQAQQQRELERQQQEQDRKAQALQQQQEQARRGQARQQPIQEQREPQRQKQQELEQGQPERRAQQQPNQGRIQQPRQHQSVENQAQQPRQPQSPENQAQQSKYPQSQRRQAEPQKEG